MSSEGLPSYKDFSVVEEIGKLIDDALEIEQEFLANEYELERIDKLINSNFTPEFVDAKKSYAELLEESRNSATELRVHIQDFTAKSVNIVLNPGKFTFETRRMVIEKAAVQLGEAAKESRVPYDTQMVVVKTQLEAVREAVIAKSDRLQAGGKEPSNKLAGQIVEITSVTERFSGLIGKLGNFNPIWVKLESDAAALIQLVDAGVDEANEEVVTQDISIAVELYNRIEVALDNYALKV